MQWQIGPPIPSPPFIFFLSLCETATILKPAPTIPRVPSSTKLPGFSSRRRLFYHIIHLLKAFPSIFVITVSNFIFLISKTTPYPFTLLSSRFLVNVLYPFQRPSFASPDFPACDALPFLPTHYLSCLPIL